MTALEKAKLAAKALDDKKASDIEIIDVKERTSLSEYFVVASCQSTVQVRARSEERRVGKECRSRWSPYH